MTSHYAHCSPLSRMADSQPMGTTIPESQARQLSDKRPSLRQTGEKAGISHDLPPLTHAQRAAAVVRCRALVAKYAIQWEQQGCFAAKGNLDRVSGLLAQLEGQQ
jgi:hypothetical protein